MEGEEQSAHACRGRASHCCPPPPENILRSMTSVSSIPRDLDSFLAENDTRIHGELFDLLRIPSISARSEHTADVARAADWLAQAMRDIGMDSAIHQTDGHPIVLGEWRRASPNAPTVLVYGHYDVQPVEPLELWTSPPFEPTERDGKLFARGSVDDKGQLYIHVKAAEEIGRASCRERVYISAGGVYFIQKA